MSDWRHLPDVWAQAARHAINALDIEANWLPPGYRLYDPARHRDSAAIADPRGGHRRIYAQRPESAEACAVVLHECGHFATGFRGDTIIEEEAHAESWAAQQWRAWGLPRYDVIERRLDARPTITTAKVVLPDPLPLNEEIGA